MITENLELRKAIQATIPDDHHGSECHQWTIEAMRAIAAIYLEHAKGNEKDAQVGFALLCVMGRTLISIGEVTIEKEKE